MCKFIIDFLTWGIAAIFFAVLLIMTFWLKPEDVDAIFNYLNKL
jgi:hypothetical protein